MRCGSAPASSRTVVISRPGKPLGRLASDAPQRVGRLVAEHAEPRVVGQPEDPGRLAEVGRQLGLQRVLPDADRALEPGARPRTRRWISRAYASGSSVSTARNASSQPSTSTTASSSRSVAITSADAASYAGLSTGRKTASGHRAQRRAQRQSGVHAVLASLVRRGADHTALGRVAVTTDDDREPAQLRPAQHLDGGDELVEVDVQHPTGHSPVWPQTPDSGSHQPRANWRKPVTTHGVSRACLRQFAV